MADVPLVSIVCITYNQAKYLESTLDSLVCQKTSFPYEIVVGDDCSNDSTSDVLKSFTISNPLMVRAESNIENLGMNANFLKTLKRARGAYIAICDGDDIWTDPQKLQMQVDLLSSQDRIGLVHTDLELLTEHLGTEFESKQHRHGYVSGSHAKGQFFSLLLENNIGTCTVMFRKELFDQYIDISDLMRASCPDYFLWLEFAHRTEFAYIPSKTAAYRVLDESASRSLDPDKRLLYWEGARNIREFYLEKYPLSEKRELAVRAKHTKSELRLASQSKNLDSVRRSFKRLQKLGAVSLVDRLIYKLSHHGVLSSSFVCFIRRSSRQLVNLVRLR